MASEAAMTGLEASVPADFHLLPISAPRQPYSTVTLFARFRGLSTSVPRAQAVW